LAANSDNNSKRKGEHLKQYQWKKGQPSPNPSGRPKQVLTDKIRAILELPYEGTLPPRFPKQLKNPTWRGEAPPVPDQ